MQLFGSFKLLIALLGSSSPLLGPIWSQNGPQNGSQNYPKVGQQIVQKMISKKVNFKPILGTKMGPQIGNFGGRGTGKSCRSFLTNSRFQDGSKMAQDGLKKPKIAY